MADMAQRKGWLLFIGILLFLLGLFLLVMPIIGSLLSVFFLGCLLLVGGLAHILSAMVERPTENFWMHLLIAVLMFIIGVLMLVNPHATLLTLTLLITVFLLCVGVFRTLSGLIARVKGWEWVVVNGIISLILGLIILSHWPTSSLWVIGLFVGIDFLFAGWSLIIAYVYLRKEQAIA